MKKPKFKDGDKVYYVWAKELRSGKFVSFSAADPELAYVTGRMQPIAVEMLNKTAAGAKRKEAKRLMKEGVEVFESFGRDEFKRAMRVRRHAQKFDPAIPLEPTWLDDIRTAVNDGPIGSTTMVGHAQLSSALAFIEKTLGLKR